MTDILSRIDDTRPPPPAALQRIGCEHPHTVAVGTLSEPYVHRCINPNCGAEWQETDWRRQVWPHREHPVVSIQPDPRISNQRPAWLADDEAWRDQLQAMDRDDCHWIDKHWELAGGKGPAVDTSWVTTETIGGLSIDSAWWPVLFIVVAIVVCLGAGVLGEVLFGGGPGWGGP